MSETFKIKSRSNDASASEEELIIERSVLDVRKAYADMDESKFVNMYNRKYGVRASNVTKVLQNQSQILELRKSFSLLTQIEFADHCNKTLKIKKDFVLMVLQS